MSGANNLYGTITHSINAYQSMQWFTICFYLFRVKILINFGTMPSLEDIWGNLVSRTITPRVGGGGLQVPLLFFWDTTVTSMENYPISLDIYFILR